MHPLFFFLPGSGVGGCLDLLRFSGGLGKLQPDPLSLLLKKEVILTVHQGHVALLKLHDLLDQCPVLLLHLKELFLLGVPGQKRRLVFVFEQLVGELQLLHLVGQLVNQELGLFKLATGLL